MLYQTADTKLYRGTFIFILTINAIMVQLPISNNKQKNTRKPGQSPPATKSAGFSVSLWLPEIAHEKSLCAVEASSTRLNVRHVPLAHVKENGTRDLPKFQRSRFTPSCRAKRHDTAFPQTKWGLYGLVGGVRWGLGGGCLGQVSLFRF